MQAPDPAPGRLHGLFPSDIVTIERCAEGDIAALSAGEAACLGRAGAKRAREFAAGRQCVRTALQQFGVLGWDLTVRPDRTPAWPQGLVGSISHTTGFCAAAVGRSRDWRSIGLDVEIDGRVDAELYPQFLTLTELELLEGRRPETADVLATLIFSAKEAFYKAQYPVTAEWLEFADIEVLLPADLSDAGDIKVRPTRPLQMEAAYPQPWRGRYARFDGFVAAGFVFPA